MSESDAMTRLREAVHRHKVAIQEEKDVRNDRDQAIADALNANEKPVDVARLVDMSTEQVRRIARKRSVPRLREPTATSRKPQEPR